jgi:hydrogenase maturation protein HypF
VDVIDTRPLIRAVSEDVSRGTDPRRIARRFHSTVVEIITETCRAIQKQTALEAVVLSGGVFMNGLLSLEAAQSLRQAAFRVYQHRLVPPNDGGLSLGQLAVAVAAIPTPENKTVNPASMRRQSDRGNHFSPDSSLQEDQAHVPRHSR